MKETSQEMNGKTLQAEETVMERLCGEGKSLKRANGWRSVMVKQDRAHDDLERKEIEPGFAPFFSSRTLGSN